MRVSTLTFYNQGVTAMQNQQARLQKTELQIASGLRVSKPSDDPAAAVKVLDLKASLDSLDQYSRNSAIAEASLGFEESVVANVNNTLQRIRELSVQGNNSTYQDRDKQSIAQEIYQRLDELVSLANTRDSQGEYIFGGFKVDSPPFVKIDGEVSYRGDQGQRLLQIGDGSKVATRDSGLEVFERIRSGDGNISVRSADSNSGSAVVGAFGLVATFQPDDYTVTFDQASPDAPITYQVTDSASNVVSTGDYNEGSSISFAGAQFKLGGTPAPGDEIFVSPSGYQDIFTTVKSIADALNSPAPDAAARADFHNKMGQGLANLDQALDKVTAIRAGIGARLNNLETLEEINQDFKLQMETTLSETQDLDYAEAISRFNLQLTALQAAQQAFVKASGLSLFQYL
ncbi:MAG: flagellar hook-associated protein FlgL [Pseudohongiellaceae bacterium]